MFNLAVILAVIACAIPLAFLVAFGLIVAGGTGGIVVTIIAVLIGAAFYGTAGFLVIKGIATGK
jgi:hypothetical protein